MAGPLIFGEVLFDCFPDGSRVLGGAPFNVAWHCHAFGLQPLFVSRIGEDEAGQLVAQAMQTWGMNTSALQIDREHPTGIVEISFQNNEPAYNIVPDSAWDFIDPEQLPEMDRHSMLYHGSLALRQEASANSLQALKNKITCPLFIDVNLRAPWWNQPALEAMLEQGRWIKLNSDELRILVGHGSTLNERVEYLFAHYPAELIIVTEGSAGASIFNRTERVSVKPDTTITVVDTVGAGDAFCSVLLLGLEMGWPLQLILNRAQQFASAVVGQRGATTQHKSFYSDFIEHWKL